MISRYKENHLSIRLPCSYHDLMPDQMRVNPLLLLNCLEHSLPSFVHHWLPHTETSHRCSEPVDPSGPGYIQSSQRSAADLQVPLIFYTAIGLM
ncbi:hypothetical protein BO70DRAFT_209569 [Aspergillus heteromorphus CBS 117.55]|uniref:Uncharacterized protein n=1 Tax=Aspergillus heteromorphus CBS 117.55 TaxID=1448321 RepID=A0A317WLW4_9EURO|nr:uncharacterized protein BO70DRAFT_209569 [Aspergillus heteromorphus CBS 117.55]PWY86681.1 hypothetical protein BO70DRAFT_209569 [Aspergillus heteromorphus CBS 117.55]